VDASVPDDGAGVDALGVDVLGVDVLGVDALGVDALGVDALGVDAAGAISSSRSGFGGSYDISRLRVETIVRSGTTKNTATM